MAIGINNESWASYMIAKRRHFHAHPELSYQESHTQNYILSELNAYPDLNAEVIARTGIICDYNWGGKGPLIALRADMDALPIEEKTGLSFCSKYKGLMHACGHDSHMAILLGVIHYCVAQKPDVRLRFIFQPSEENNFNDEKGWSGAKRVVEEGGLEGVKAVLGLHQRPTLPSGSLGLQKGAVMAAAMMFELTVVGKSAHAGAEPEKGVDSILITSDWIQSIQSIVSRRISPRSTGVISVGTINGGEIANVIADSVRMTGTIRTRDAETRAQILREIHLLNTSMEQRYGCKLHWHIVQDVPLTVNDPHLHDVILRAVKKELPDSIIGSDVDMMAAEDFSFYGQQVPAFFCFLGTSKNDSAHTYGLHHPKMDIDESALLNGAKYFLTAAKAISSEGL
ncbi:MAG: amidohydrolase [Bacteroidetes bacterium]|nr:amidohydrolase [Bacteroidota bacterium]